MIHSGTRFEMIEGFQVDDGPFRLEYRIVKSTLGNAPDEGHLAAFESEPDTAAAACLLTLVTFAGSFSMPAAFAAAEAFHTMLGTGTWFEIGEVHRFVFSSWSAPFTMLSW